MSRFGVILSIFYWMLGIQCFGQFDNPIVNGSISTNEYGTHTNGQNQGYNTASSTTWYCTWNNDSIFFAASGGFDPNSTGTTNGDAACIYLDINPDIPVNNAVGTTSGTGFDGITPTLPFSADAFLFSKHSGGSRVLASGGSWGSPDTGKITQYINYSTNIIELKIAWTDLGLSQRPDEFNWLGFISYDNRSYSGSNGSFAHIPELNPGASTSPIFIRYYTIDITTDNTTVQPFEQESYSHGGGSITFGDINVWDFTMNTNGATITRGGTGFKAWNISNDLIVNDGTVDFGSIAEDDVIGRNIYIGASGTLKGSSNTTSNIKIYRNFENNGTFTSNNTKFQFNGSSVAQTISGDLDTDNCFGRLEINNANGVIDNTDDSLAVSDSLILTNGVMQTSKFVALRNGAIVKPEGGSSASYIDGKAVWGMDDTDSTIFPVGDDAEWARIGVKPENAKSGRKYMASYSKSVYSDLSLKTGSKLTHVSFVEYWDISETTGLTGTDKSAKVSLYWRDYSNVSTVAIERDSLKVCHYDGSDWDEVDIAFNSINNNSSSEGVVQTKSYTSNFSPFTLGTTVSGNPLPVDLISFSGSLSENRREIELNWITASELNCDQFILQKQKDNHWEIINLKACNQFSNELIQYTFTDNQLESQNVYRLVQHDINGNETLYGPIVVDVNNTDFKIIPNPTSAYFTISNFHKIENITIIDAYGKPNEVSQIDSLFNTDGLRRGVYTVLIADKAGRLHTNRLLITH